MALITIPSGTSTFTMSTADLHILQDGDSIITPTTTAIDFGGQDFAELVVFGSIFAGDDGIKVDDGTDSVDIIIGLEGEVVADDNAIDVTSCEANIVNYGQIYTASGSGIVLNEPTVCNPTEGSGGSKINNYGQIVGDFGGIKNNQNGTVLTNYGSITSNFFNAVDNTADGMVINNFGSITGKVAIESIATGLKIFNAGDIVSTSTSGFTINTFQAFFLENSGLIQSSSGSAINASDEAETVINTGSIVGKVILNGGDDLYDARDTGTAFDGVFGGDGSDTLKGGDANDLLDGGDESDLLRGDAGDDTLIGGANDDTIYGGQGDDNINGNVGNDLMKGNDGDDSIVGEGGKDTLKGGDGDDTLVGGRKQDILLGGEGADVFVFESADQSAVDGTRDQIRDFEIGVDVIDVSLLGVTSFIGTDAFTASHTPELRLDEKSDGSTTIRIDVDGDGLSDSTIKVTNAVGLGVDDFIL